MTHELVRDLLRGLRNVFEGEVEGDLSKRAEGNVFAGYSPASMDPRTALDLGDEVSCAQANAVS